MGMKKEVILAIILGFGLGLIITFGIWTANKSLQQLKNRNAETMVSPAPDTKITPEPTRAQQGAPLQLAVTSPEDESISNQDSVTVAGKASPKANIAITYEGGEKLIQADDAGNFSQEIDLIGGYNTIMTTTFDTDGNESTETRVVTYTTAKI